MAQYKQANFFSTTGNGSKRLFSKREIDWDRIVDIIKNTGFDVEDVKEFESPDGRMNVNIYLDCNLF